MTPFPPPVPFCLSAMAGRELASFLLFGLARAHTPWDLTAPCSGTPVCPYINPARDKRSQMGEDIFVRKEFFCDVCPPAHLVRPVPSSGSLEAGQRSYVEIGALDGLQWTQKTGTGQRTSSLFSRFSAMLG